MIIDMGAFCFNAKARDNFYWLVEGALGRVMVSNLD